MHKFITLYSNINSYIVAKGYRLYFYSYGTGKEKYFSRLADVKNGLLAGFKLTRRLFRAEIRSLYHFKMIHGCA